MKKNVTIFFLLFISCFVLAQTKILLNQEFFSFSDTIKMTVANSEKLAFKACFPDINYRIEKFESGQWKETQIECCMCDLQRMPQCFIDTIGHFKMRASFMWQTGKYRIVLDGYGLKEIDGKYEKINRTIYSNPFYVVPKLIEGKANQIFSIETLSNYETTKNQKQTLLIVNEIFLNLNDSARFTLLNPLKKEFKSYYNVIDYSIEEYINGTWENTHDRCYACDWDLEPIPIKDSIALFSITGGFTKNTGEYRIKLKYFDKITQLTEVVYSNSFFILPPQLKQIESKPDQLVKLKYYQNSKLIEAQFVPNVFVINQPIGDLGYAQFIDNLQLKLYRLPNNLKIKCQFEKTYRQEKYYIDLINYYEARKYLELNKWLFYYKGNEYAITSQIIADFNVKNKMFTPELTNWLENRGKTYVFTNAENPKESRVGIPFEHNIISYQANSPENLHYFANELIGTGYFTNVSNVVVEPITEKSKKQIHE